MKTRHITPFLDEDFLLQSDLARELYHEVAADLPIIDYHCHLSPAQIAENRQFAHITEIWLDGDHYKWRAMRANGISEQKITGSATAREKFVAFAETLPYVMRNPLYHWTHMELQDPFGIKDLLNPASANMIFDRCNELLGEDEFRVIPLLKSRKVEVVGTTDDPCDDLEAHKQIAQQSHGIGVFPTFRPDKYLKTNDPMSFNLQADKLGEAAGIDIQHFDEFIAALRNRIEYFHAHGCRLSDHGLTHIPFSHGNGQNSKGLFLRIREGHLLSPSEQDHLQLAILHELGCMYAQKSWCMQLHLGAMRNTNHRLLTSLGPDTGFDSIGDYRQGEGLGRFLDALDKENNLPKTILYNLNPADNELFATMVGNFNDGSVAGKIQWGSAWWFLDQKDGMTKQINALSNMGVLGRFVGMLTDSRSFLSYSRHEYFRRLLCNLFAEDVLAGELPHDQAWISELIRKICYQNAKEYFGFPIPGEA